MKNEDCPEYGGTVIYKDSENSAGNLKRLKLI